MDETGLDICETYPYGWSLRGERCYAPVTGGSRERISVIAGLHGSELQAPCWLKGYTDAETFNVWLEHHLLPVLIPGMVIIMDNARFHKSPKTKELIENAGCRLLFLPPYSPDLNPIEHRWFPLKNSARKILQTLLCLTSAIEAAILCA